MHGRKQLSAQDYQHWIAKWIRNFCHYKLMAFGGILVWLWIIFALFFTINVINCQSLNHNTYVHRYYAAKSLHSCLTVRPHRRQPTRLCRPWDSPGKNSGVGCYFLLQCMKVKNKANHSVVSDSKPSCGLQPTRLLQPWDFPGKSTGVGCHYPGLSVPHHFLSYIWTKSWNTK